MSFWNPFTNKKTVLIVEDDVKLRTALREAFEAAGLAVLEAGDAREVLGILATNQPDALVLDLILPVKDGISLLEELRNSGHMQPVAILSNLLGSDSLRADAARLDAEFYNKSATSLGEIVEAINKHL